MGPSKARVRGIGGVGNTSRTPPLSPESGSGGAGVLPGTRVSFNPSAAVSEIGDVTTGRVTLAMVNLTVLLFLGFYYWTRTAQGGG